MWARNWILRRNALGAYAGLIRELDVEDVEGFRQYHRLDREAFREVLELVGNLITKDSIMRSSISPAERLSVTLRFLATGKCSIFVTGLIYIQFLHSRPREVGKALTSSSKSAYPKIEIFLSELSFLKLGAGLEEVLERYQMF